MFKLNLFNFLVVFNVLCSLLKRILERLWNFDWICYLSSVISRIIRRFTIVWISCDVESDDFIVFVSLRDLLNFKVKITLYIFIA